MPPRNPIAALVREWVGKAEDDLTAAKATLKLGRDCPTNIVCFHAQQCVEKYLKALLVMRQIAFAKTHDLRVIMAQIRAVDHVDLEAAEQDRLTESAVVTRYPGSYPPVSLAEARQAVRIARRVRSQVRKLLPRASLRR